MSEPTYFRVQQHGATLQDTYRPLLAADCREIARQALAAARTLERSHEEWLREAIKGGEEFLERVRKELAELEAVDRPFDHSYGLSNGLSK